MTPPRAVTRYAPGKLFVVGEYAVVEPGNQAVLTAVDRGVSVTVADRDRDRAPGPGASREDRGTDVEVVSDLCPEGVRLRRHGARLTGRTPADEQRARDSLAHVVSALETVEELLAGRGAPAPALHLRISSALHDNGTKYGLGSSGAVTVATVDAVAAHRGTVLPPEDRFKLALLATARLAPGSSGGDLAAAAWGGWIAYRAPDREAVRETARHRGVEEALRAPWPGFGLRRLPPPRGLALEVGWTGSPASTTSLVADLDRSAWRGGPAHRRFLERTEDCVSGTVRALRGGDGPGLLHHVRDARQVLAELDADVRLGVFTPRLTALCDAAEAVGGAAKPSGAGGGDCGIALLDAEARPLLAQLRERWAAAGVLPVPVRATGIHPERTGTTEERTRA